MNVHKIVQQKGMLLYPQHLQHNSRYHDSQAEARTQLLGSYSWGFLVPELDRQFLNIGRLVISQASGVLPDGSLFELGGGTEPLALDVPPSTSNVSIYLVLPLITGNHIEVRQPEQAEVPARCTAYNPEVVDSSADGDPMVRASCAWPDFRLLLGEWQSDRTYIKLKVAVMLDTTPDGVISLDPDSVPSYLHTHASTYPPSCPKEVTSMLGHCGDTIAKRIQSNDKVDDAEVGDFMMLRLINRTELLLRHYLGLEQVHLRQLYQALPTMLGDLATLGSKSKHSRLDSRYQHSGQGASFRRLMEAIRRVLSIVFEQHVIELPLQACQYGILISFLHGYKLPDSASFVFAASANCESEELRQRPSACLEAGVIEYTRQLVDPHLSGVRVKPLLVAPWRIPFYSNKTYFILGPNAEDMTQLERSGGFAFYASGGFSELELKFWAIRD